MDDSILDALGSPLVRIPSPDGTTIAAKMESFNPGGSIKVRPALEMVLGAERRGEVEPGDTLVEATSGNTGIGLALVAAARGYDLTIVMPSSVSSERRRLIRAYGASLELVEEGMSAANDRAEELASRDGRFQISQFDNPDNPAAHERTTAPEIIEQVGDRTVDAFVATVGTGGTISGTARRLRETYPDLSVVGVEPATSPWLSTGEYGEHDFQGMGPDFMPETLDRTQIDEVESVSIEKAAGECRRLASESGMLVGQSSGAAAIASSRVAQRLAGENERPLVVTIFPDSGERYLSTGLFD